MCKEVRKYYRVEVSQYTIIHYIILRNYLATVYFNVTEFTENGRHFLLLRKCLCFDQMNS